MGAARLDSVKPMLGSGFASSPADASPATFAEALDQLKTQGCLVLVVGPVGDDAKYAGCRRLLGDQLSEARRRLFITTDAGLSTHPGAKATCGHCDPADSRSITYETTARSATATTDDPTMLVENEAVDSDLGDVVEATHDAISALDRRAGGLDPGELRVCVDDLDAMIAHDDDIDVVEFVRDLRSAVLDAKGMCHAHLSRDVPGAPVDALVRYFDAIVEVDSSGTPRQRWHVRHAGITTDWLEL